MAIDTPGTGDALGALARRIRAIEVRPAATLFVNGQRFTGDLDALTVRTALQNPPSEP